MKKITKLYLSLVYCIIWTSILVMAAVLIIFDDVHWILKFLGVILAGILFVFRCVQAEALFKQLREKNG